MAIDPEFVRALNAALLLILFLITILLTVASASHSSSYARADRFSQRVRLPYGSPATRGSVTRCLRTSSLATAITMATTTVVVSPVLLTPLATSVTFSFVVVMLMLVATGLVSTVVSIRERLFHPAPEARRIARARALGAADYLGPLHRALPWILGAAAAIALGGLLVEWIRHPGQVDQAFATAAVFGAFVATGVFVGTPALERRVLAQPQPAGDTLELAWDDALRSTALGSLRLSAALTAWMTLALAIGAMWLGSDALFSSLAQQLPTWGVIALTFVYPSTGRRLRADLYPEWLRAPASTGGAPA